MKVKAFFDNPFYGYKKGHEFGGRVNIYVGLHRDTPPFKHTYGDALKFLKSDKLGIQYGTFLKGAGVYQGGAEPMMQLSFVNYGSYRVAYSEFRQGLLATAKKLAVKFGQKVVMVEEVKPDGAYFITDYVNYKAFKSRKEADEERERFENLVEDGVAFVIGKEK